ncbi:glycoside hydrolase family 43 protein [Paraflavisolibacter sp. H34]|uniref:glycoside hydrolase family 43 protein n=1 Tax=Huijunlia imazamoxiresistens TaxID=3127457 RepID=UPI0030177544
MKKQSILLFFIPGLVALLTAFIPPARQYPAEPFALSDKVKAERDAKALQIPQGYLQHLRWDLLLDSVGKNGSLITWKSGNPTYISDKGKLLKRSPRGSTKVKVQMTATIHAGRERRTRIFEALVAPEEQQYAGYLFAYFEAFGETGQREQLRFGVSADATNWYALNNNQPVLASSSISQTGGIRDPHILRGEDEKSFFMVATDMFTFKNGWDHNPGIVLLKSGDLVNWSHGIVDLEKSYPQKFRNVKWVWAPQTIYDPAAGKYLVYFTVRLKDDPALDFYCAYANREFTAFESEPQLMFKAKYGAIDGDIIYKGGLYHFFYKGNTKNESGKEIRNGIQQATGKTLQGPWKEDFQYLDAYAAQNIPVEGSGIFKLNNLDEFVLMYDMYKDHRYEFQRSTDLFRFTPKPESFTKNFNPRHGTVMSITREEAKRLHEKWGGVPAELLQGTPAKR